MLNGLLRLYDGFFGLFSYLWDPMVLVLRLHYGWLFFAAGWGKFAGMEGTIANFTSFGIPFPEYMAPFVAGVEAVGGLLLLLGLFSRFASLFLFVTMAVAYLTADIADVTGVANSVMAWFNSVGEVFSGAIAGNFTAVARDSSAVNSFVTASPFFYFLTSYLVMAFGPGFFSIDRLLRRNNGGGEA